MVVLLVMIGTYWLTHKENKKEEKKDESEDLESFKIGVNEDHLKLG